MANPNPSPKTRFKKGQTGNPKGRPVTKPLSNAYLSLLSLPVSEFDQLIPEELSVAEGIARAVIQQAIKGRVEAAREIADRIEGKATQPIEASVALDDFWAEAAQLAAAKQAA